MIHKRKMIISGDKEEKRHGAINLPPLGIMFRQRRVELIDEGKKRGEQLI